MQIRIVAFTKQGAELAKKMNEPLIRQGHQIKVYTLEKYCNDPVFLPLSKKIREWTEESFEESEALIFVGATGIAVRAIAPFVKSKYEDPAVVVLDEKGKYIISLLSGHVGGANKLARQLAALTEGTPIISTATDVRGLFAVDEWAKEQGYKVRNSEAIKMCATTLLNGERIRLKTSFKIKDPLPKQFTQTDKGSYTLEITTHFHKEEESLQVVPPIITIGIGCKRGTPMEVIDTFIQTTLKEANICLEAVGSMATIELKKDEEGLLAVAKKYHWPIYFHTSEALMALAGDFSSSLFVKRVTKTDNVCERAAVATSRGELIVKKKWHSGVTIALAQEPFVIEWTIKKGDETN